MPPVTPNTLSEQIEILKLEIDAAKYNLKRIPFEGRDRNNRPYWEDAANLSNWLARANERLTEMEHRPFVLQKVTVRGRKGRKLTLFTKRGRVQTRWRYKGKFVKTPSVTVRYRDIRGRFAKPPS